MKRESGMWKKLRPVLLAAKLDPVRVENPIHPGTPDVNLADGRWIELKCIPSWPVRAASIVRIDHFTAQQRVWLFRRWKYAPGSTMLLLNVEAARQWLLFDGDIAAKVVARTVTAVHYQQACAVLGARDLPTFPQVIEETRKRRTEGTRV